MYLFYYRVNTNLANVRCIRNHWFMCWPNFTHSNKLCVLAKNSIKLFCMCTLCVTYAYPVSVSDFTDFFKNRRNSIKLCWNKSMKMPRLNDDERNQAIGMQACHQLLSVSRHFGWLIDWMVFYAAFNSISVISRRQFTLFMLSWISPVLERP